MKKCIKNRYCSPAPLFLLLVILLSLSLFPRQANLISNVDGKIRVIILHYGDGSYFDGFWFDMTVLYRELLNKMDRDVSLLVLRGNDKTGDRLADMLGPFADQKLPDGSQRLKFLTVNVKTGDFYPWARDANFIQTDENDNLIFLDVGFNYPPFPITHYDQVFKNAITRAGMIHRGGGNVRVSSREIFIGMDTILGINKTPRWSQFGHTPETFYSLAENYLAKDLTEFKKKIMAYTDLLHHILAPEKKLIIPGRERFFSQLEMGDFIFDKKTVFHTGAQAAYHTDVYMGLGQVDEDGKRVYIPQFGFKKMDEAAARAYRSAGFRVTFIKGLLTNALTARNDAAGLDCLTSEIRTPVKWAEKYKVKK